MNLKRLLPIYLGAIIGPMGGVGIIPLLPVLCSYFEISIQWASLTVTLYMIPYVVFQLFSGSIAQVFDTRRTLLFGFGTYLFIPFALRRRRCPPPCTILVEVFPLALQG